MVINTNMSARSTARLLSDSSALLSKSLARLSSGSRIVSPEDDVAGLATALRFDAQINRLSAAKSNVGNAVSLAQTQDGFLSKVAKALDRMSELAVLAQDITKTDTDRGLYQQEYNTLGSYITEVSTKDFNGVSLFGGIDLDVTIDSDANKFTMTGVDLTATEYTDATGADISTTSGAATALTQVKGALTQLSTDRATVGSNVARLNTTSDQLGLLRDNLSAASSRIRDVDVADESAQFARYSILVQAGTAMLAQANTLPQSALRLLG